MLSRLAVMSQSQRVTLIGAWYHLQTITEKLIAAHRAGHTVTVILDRKAAIDDRTRDQRDRMLELVSNGVNTRVASGYQLGPV